MGIEPTQSAWKAGVLPLNYTRRSNSNLMVEGGGFEPPKVEPADLQSDPFGRSGTPPSQSGHYAHLHLNGQALFSLKPKKIISEQDPH